MLEILEIRTAIDAAKVRQEFINYLKDNTGYAVIRNEKAATFFDIGKGWEGKSIGGGRVPETYPKIKGVVLRHGFRIEKEYAVETLDVLVTLNASIVEDEIPGELGDTVNKLHNFLKKELRFEDTKPIFYQGKNYKFNDTLFMMLGRNELPFWGHYSVEQMTSNIKKLNSLYKRILTIMKPRRRGRIG